ncbi:MAG TPA: hypothetical protein VNX86_16510 [Rhizomicrobium sp.]|jgi:hypothetical protein|nr:hypothetical protein [Rhizomicrobium sp.]
MTDEVRDNLIKSISANAPADEPAFKWKTIPQGTATTVWAGFVAPAELVGGKFCEDCPVAVIVEGAELRRGVRSHALDPTARRRSGRKAKRWWASGSRNRLFGRLIWHGSIAFAQCQRERSQMARSLRKPSPRRHLWIKASLC